jgi:hypothetical protein
MRLQNEGLETSVVVIEALQAQDAEEENLCQRSYFLRVVARCAEAHDTQCKNIDVEKLKPRIGRHDRKNA